MKVNFGQLKVTSPAFEHGGQIPMEYVGDGAPHPPLHWDNVPGGTESFVLLSEDPDAPILGGLSHWVLYNIPAEVASIDHADSFDSATDGTNGIGQTGWIPPAPPPGHGTHFYYFHLYALGGGVELVADLSRDELLPLIHDAVIEQARLVGWVAG
jgi:Raf kinase inhibitor-like YbhB/YbcL family protein